MEQLFLNNSISHWLLDSGIAGVVLIITVFIRGLIRRSYQRMAQTVEVELMEIPLQIASHTKLSFLVIVSCFFGSLALNLPEAAQLVVRKILVIAVCWQAGIWSTAAALAWLANSRGGQSAIKSGRAGTMNVVAVMIRIVIWSIVVLLTLENIGIDITTLVAGLGIGGIAIALAVQNVLGDLLASLSITLDKPFEVGDLLFLDDFQGKVEQIGIKSTRLRSVTGEQIIVSNADLLKSRLRNFGRMSERRMLLKVGVAYDTSLDQVQQVPKLMQQAIESHPTARFDRCYLLRFGDSAIEFEAGYFVMSSKMADSMDVQHAIHMALLAQFAKAGIAFAYPTRRVLLDRTAETGA